MPQEGSTVSRTPRGQRAAEKLNLQEQAWGLNLGTPATWKTFWNCPHATYLLVAEEMEVRPRARTYSLTNPMTTISRDKTAPSFMQNLSYSRKGASGPKMASACRGRYLRGLHERSQSKSPAITAARPTILFRQRVAKVSVPENSCTMHVVTSLFRTLRVPLMKRSQTLRRSRSTLSSRLVRGRITWMARVLEWTRHRRPAPLGEAPTIHKDVSTGSKGNKCSRS